MNLVTGGIATNDAFIPSLLASIVQQCSWDVSLHLLFAASVSMLHHRPYMAIWYGVSLQLDCIVGVPGHRLRWFLEIQLRFLTAGFTWAHFVHSALCTKFIRTIALKSASVLRDPPGIGLFLLCTRRTQ